MSCTPLSPFCCWEYTTVMLRIQVNINHQCLAQSILCSRLQYLPPPPLPPPPPTSLFRVVENICFQTNLSNSFKVDVFNAFIKYIVETVFCQWEFDSIWFFCPYGSLYQYKNIIWLRKLNQFVDDIFWLLQSRAPTPQPHFAWFPESAFRSIIMAKTNHVVRVSVFREQHFQPKPTSKHDLDKV